MNVLGIDIGGSGIKAAVVDTGTGRLITPRLRVDTPSPARPAAVGRAVGSLVERFGWRGPVGVGFPGIIRQQQAHSAPNLHDAWIGVPIGRFFSDATHCPAWVVNDADAAGLAEVEFGAARRKRGSIMLLTLGTGIGSALFRDGVLYPNAELGHLEFRGAEAEDYAAASVRKELDLTWPHWGRRVNALLEYLEFILSPDLIILGGGVSTKFEKFRRYLKVDTTVIPARLHNEAGVVGAALAALRNLPSSRLRVRRFVPPAVEESEEKSGKPDRKPAPARRRKSGRRARAA